MVRGVGEARCVHHLRRSDLPSKLLHLYNLGFRMTYIMVADNIAGLRLLQQALERHRAQFYLSRQDWCYLAPHSSSLPWFVLRQKTGRTPNHTHRDKGLFLRCRSHQKRRSTLDLPTVLPQKRKQGPNTRPFPGGLCTEALGR